MNCPKCNGDTFVVDTRGVRRRRHCKACGCRFTTEEVLVVGRRKIAQPEPSRKAAAVPKRKPKAEPKPKPEKRIPLIQRAVMARRRIEEMRDMAGIEDDYDYIPEKW